MAGHRSSMRPRIAALSLLHRPFLSDRVLRPLKCLKYAGVPQAAFCHAGRTDCERVGGKVSHGESPDSGRLGSISVYPGPSRGAEDFGRVELRASAAAGHRQRARRSNLPARELEKSGMETLNECHVTRHAFRLQTFKPLKGAFKLGRSTDGTQRHTS